MPHKKFQHFIKWFDIFIRAKTNMQKMKGKIKQKIKGKAYLVPRAKPANPAQPAHRGSGVFFPLPRTQAARWNATEPAGATRRRRAPSRPPRALFSRPGDVSQLPRSIPPLHELPPLLSRLFHRRPRNTPERRRAHAWPSTSRSQAKVSREFVVVVFIDLRKESEPDASTSSLASSSSSPAAVDRLRIPATPAPPRASDHSS